MTIWFDMDGTIADLYAVENWLSYLLAEETFPYENAMPMMRFSSLARRLNKIQSKGYKLGVISWGSKTASSAYLAEIQTAKMKWLKKHLASVHFDEIEIVPYGTPKSNFRKSDSDILFDDEERNRIEWGEESFSPDRIMEILKILS